METVRIVSKLSRWIQYCPDGLYSVQTVLIISGRCQYCPDGVNTVQTVSILSRRFQYSLDSFKKCLDVFNTAFLCHNIFNSTREMIVHFVCVVREDYAFFYVSKFRPRFFHNSLCLVLAFNEWISLQGCPNCEWQKEIMSNFGETSPKRRILYLFSSKH